MKKIIFAILLVQILLTGIFFLSSSLPALAAEGEWVELVNPLKFVGVNSPGELVLKVFRGFAGLMGSIAIAFVVFNGFKLVIAGSFAPGKDQKRNEAKEGLLWSVGGFIVALLSFTIISGTAQFLGFEQSRVGSDTINPGILNAPQPGDFMSVLNYVMMNFLGILGFATILMIIYYGYRYITSAGNEESIEAAKTGLKWAILGFIVTILAFTIISGIRQLLL
ncbi:MAG: hypothetical protein U1C57_01345 [Candidatus Doudnabacteria bacterium]|nr:hypothetical protein [Candidatus Doudnabacteria bacterium]